MKSRAGIVFMMLLIGLYAVVANGAQFVQAKPEDLISLCGNPSALTAIGRMPQVRIVVYDPLSNSFGYVAPCAGDPVLRSRDAQREDNSGGFQREGELRDRSRLVLTTQKIRLLLMPYNPNEGAMTLEVKPGQGTEFELVPAGKKVAAPTTPPADQKPSGDKDKTTKPPVVDKTPATEKLLNTIAASSTEPSIATAVEDTRTGTDTQALRRLDLLFQAQDQKPWNELADRLSRLDAAIAEYRASIADSRRKLTTAESTTKRLSRLGADALTGVSTQLLGKDDDTFTLAVDVPMEQLRLEAERRRRVINDAIRGANDCIATGCGGTSLAKLGSDFDDADGDVQRNGNLLKGIDDLFGAIQASSDVPHTTASKKKSAAGPAKDEWEKQKANFADAIKSMHDLQKDLESRVVDDRKALDKIADTVHADLAKISGAAAWIQRFDMPPLHDGESLTINVHRGTVADGVTREPGHANSIELRSTSADVFRFGLGLVHSGLRNPDFQTGQATTTDPATGKGFVGPNNQPLLGDDGKPLAMKELQFKDEGNGSMVMGAFIHNNWGRRSPFLTPTMFERFAPTVSIGIPVAAQATEPFNQLLLGLNWELVPGVDANIGWHWAKVRHVIDGHHVGEFNPATVDTTNLVKERFGRGIYFGLVLNSDIFNTLANGRVRQ